MLDSAMSLPEIEGAARLCVASLIGMSVGLEREWSGRASGADARFAGLRTFLLLGAVGGVSGLIAGAGLPIVGAAGIAAGSGIAIAAYIAAVRGTKPDLDGTTEVAAVVVVLLAALAGLGWLRLSSAAGAIVVLALSEKRRLHGIVRSIGENELSAGLQFAVLAVVVLPLLPAGPYLGALEFRPRALWGIVLAFCALNFASYVAERAVGSSRGYGIAGALGGLLSSTAVALAYARRSRREGEDAGALALGVIAACTVLIPRILVVSTALNPQVALAALRYLGPTLIAGVLLMFLRAGRKRVPAPAAPSDRTPLRLGNAIQMAVAFQVALSAITVLRPRLGELGLYGLAVALGLTDMDALTVSMSSHTSLVAPAIAGRALVVGMLANTTFKLGLSLVIGAPLFRRRAAAALATLAAVSAATLFAL